MILFNRILILNDIVCYEISCKNESTNKQYLLYPDHAQLYPTDLLCRMPNATNIPSEMSCKLSELECESGAVSNAKSENSDEARLDQIMLPHRL